MSNDPELLRLRQQVDDVNQQLVSVLHERAGLARRIGAYKRTAGIAAVDVAREQAMLTELLRNTPAEGFSTTALESILQAVFAASRGIVTKAQ